MALDTYSVLWRGILLRCPIAPPFLAQAWVNECFRELAERRRWSWLVKQGEFLLNAVYANGTASVTFNSNAVTGAGTAWTAAMIGRQFRVGSVAPLYTVAAVADTTHLTLDQVYGGDTSTTATYQIYNAFVTAPSDFHSFISVYDPKFNWQLWTKVMQDELNIWDAQRAQTGQAWIVCFRDYDPLAAAGTPPLPRYEVWPHQQAQYVYPFLYEARPTDLTDASATLPRYIRGDVLTEGALAKAAKWPGPSREQPNPYFDLRLAMMHETKFQAMVMEMERQDDETDGGSDISYHKWTGLPFAPLPSGDASWLQRHG